MQRILVQRAWGEENLGFSMKARPHGLTLEKGQKMERKLKLCWGKNLNHCLISNLKGGGEDYSQCITYCDRTPWESFCQMEFILFLFGNFRNNDFVFQQQWNNWVKIVLRAGSTFYSHVTGLQFLLWFWFWLVSAVFLVQWKLRDGVHLHRKYQKVWMV